MTGQLAGDKIQLAEAIHVGLAISVPDGLIAPQLLEDAEMAYQMAVNHQTAARSNAAVTKAEVERARAALERSQTDLRYATIRSPMDGLILSRDVEIGDAVSSILVLGSQATLVMTMGDVSEVYVLGKVDEADIGQVYLGQPARIVVESFKDKQFEGEVTKISPLGVEVDERHVLLILTIRRSGRVRPWDDEITPRESDEADVVIHEDRRDEAEAWLERTGLLAAIDEALANRGEEDRFEL